MLKNTRVYIVAVLLVVFLASCVSASIAAQKGGASSGIVTNGEVIHLRLAHFFPATHPIETEVVSYWIKAVEQATGGRVRVTSYPGETLLRASDVYEGVINGIADIGLSCFSYNRGRFPVLEAFELPGITYKSSWVASKVAWEGVKILAPKEVGDTKLMMVFATGPGDLFTKVPVKTLKDLNGLEIRATGLSVKTLKSLGAVPIAMAQSETYQALAKGIVKGNLSPAEVLKGWKQGEVTKYLTKTPFLYNTLFYLTMNKGKWNSLPDDIKEAIMEVNERCFNDVAASLWDRQNEKAIRWAVDEMGIEIIELTDEEKDKWLDKVRSVQEEYISAVNDMGIDGQKVLNTVKQLADKYNNQY